MAIRVNLASQVLSKTLGNILKCFAPDEAAATRTFCLIMNTFFGCLNVRYGSIDDIRFA